MSIFLEGDYPGLRIDPEVKITDLQREVVEDYYSRDFLGKDHYNWVGNDSKGRIVVSALWAPTENSKVVHKCLLTTPRLSKEFEITMFGGLANQKSKDGHPSESQFRKTLLSYDPSFTDLTIITNPNFSEEFSILEPKHPQARATLKIGLICAFPDQVIHSQMASNKECSKRFWKFTNYMGKEIDLQGWSKYRGDMRPPGKAWYTEWNNIPAIYHVCPILNPEEIRRLHGNDVFQIVYFDAEYPKQFDPSGLDTFGEVPCIFVIVQPHGKLYRVGFCTKRNITPYLPSAPDCSLSLEEMKNTILTKIYNSPTIYCPPLNRLFFVPRGATIDEILKKCNIQAPNFVQKRNVTQTLPSPSSTAESSPKKELQVILDSRPRSKSIKDTIKKMIQTGENSSSGSLHYEHHHTPHTPHNPQTPHTPTQATSLDSSIEIIITSHVGFETARKKGSVQLESTSSSGKKSPTKRKSIDDSGSSDYSNDSPILSKCRTKPHRFSGDNPIRGLTGANSPRDVEKDRGSSGRSRAFLVSSTPSKVVSISEDCPQEIRENPQRRKIERKRSKSTMSLQRVDRSSIEAKNSPRVGVEEDGAPLEHNRRERSLYQDSVDPPLEVKRRSQESTEESQSGKKATPVLVIDKENIASGETKNKDKDRKSGGKKSHRDKQKTTLTQ